MKDNQIVIIAKGSGFSHTFDATNTKSYFMAKALKSYGLKVAILSNIFYCQNTIKANVGKYNGVRYYIPSIYPETKSKSINFFHRIIHIWKVLKFLIYAKKKWSKVHFIFDDNAIPFPVLLLFKWFGLIELIFNLEEWPISKNTTPVRKLFSHLFVLLAFISCRKFVCVSSYLVSKAQYYNKKANVFRLPALADFTNSNLEQSKEVTDDFQTIKFLYCGNVGYVEVILVVIQAYENVCLSRPTENLELILVLHGNTLELKKISDYVDQSKHLIKIKTSLPECDLFSEYSQASVLLAPLRHTVQDEARFPQKIAEYTALAKPIITTLVGDVKLYFNSHNSAVYLDDFSVDDLYKAMIFIINNRKNLKNIGLAGNSIGKKYFDFKQYVVNFGIFVTK
jgi:glycosyltransferase involved in cell wall biosynthesis